MKKVSKIWLMIPAIALLVASCGPKSEIKGFDITKSGLHYQFLNKAKGGEQVKVGDVFAVRPGERLGGFPHDGTLSPLWFRIVGEGRDMKRADIPERDVVVVGEGGETCYCYVSVSPLPGGGKTVRTWGLDVTANLPEASFLLNALTDVAASGPR